MDRAAPHGEVVHLDRVDRDRGQGRPGRSGARRVAGAGRLRRRDAAHLLGRLAGPRRRAARRLGAAGARRHHRARQLGHGRGRPRAAGRRGPRRRALVVRASAGSRRCCSCRWPTRANAAMAAHGWQRLHVTVVQVAPVAPLLASLPARDDLRSVVEAAPSREWVALMHDLDEHDPAAHLEILTGPERVGFATVLPGRRAGRHRAGLGRGRVGGRDLGRRPGRCAAAGDRLGGHAGAADLGPRPGRRRVVPAGARGQRGGAAALRALGYVTHHPYSYRALASRR